jgi:hypothetical protein
MQGVSTTVERTIRVPRTELFAWMGPLELSRILLGYGPLPAVTATSDQTRPWPQVGSARTVHLADGSSAREEITAAETPSFFAYHVGDFTSAVRHLTNGARGRWWFDDVAGDATHVRWEYTFEPRSAVTAVILFPIVRIFWRGYMRVAMDALERLAEREARSAVSTSSR